MGAEVVGAVVGADVDGDTVGAEVVGDAVGAEVDGGAVGVGVPGETVGCLVGEVVGLDVLGDVVGDVVSRMQVWPGEPQSPSEQRWVLAQLQRSAEQSVPTQSCSQMPNAVVSQPWLPSVQACRFGLAVGARVGVGVGAGVGGAVPKSVETHEKSMLSPLRLVT